MFECRNCPSLRAQLADQQELILDLTKGHAEERRVLVDQLVAVTRPESLRELRRPPMMSMTQGSEAPSRRILVRPNFPGFEPDLRPLADKEDDG